MSNFDRLWKVTELMSAKESLAAYTEASKRTDLTAQEQEFLTRAVKGQQERVARCKQALVEWHT